MVVVLVVSGVVVKVKVVVVEAIQFSNLLFPHLSHHSSETCTIPICGFIND